MNVPSEIICGFKERFVTDKRLLQSWKAPSSMCDTLLGMVIAEREWQFRNAHSPMLVTLLGIVTEEIEAQL